MKILVLMKIFSPILSWWIDWSLFSILFWDIEAIGIFLMIELNELFLSFFYGEIVEEMELFLLMQWRNWNMFPSLVLMDWINQILLPILLWFIEVIKFYKKSPLFVGDFVRSNGLQEGDFIVIYSDIKCGKYVCHPSFFFSSPLIFFLILHSIKSSFTYVNQGFFQWFYHKFLILLSLHLNGFYISNRWLEEWRWDNQRISFVLEKDQGKANKSPWGHSEANFIPNAVTNDHRNPTHLCTLERFRWQ